MGGGVKRDGGGTGRAAGRDERGGVAGTGRAAGRDERGGKRSYRSVRRAEQAAATRRAVLAAARDRFVTNGYSATTVAEIAERADVSVDTVYATVGRKPSLLRELVETSISGTGQAVPAEERDYVKQIRSATSAREMIRIYAVAVAEIQSRLAPVFIALRDAATTDPECAALWAEIATRRARNMLRLAGAMRATGELRDDLADQQVADVIWSMNAAEYWVLLVQERGWTPDQFAAWLDEAWSRLLLARPPTAVQGSSDA
jgi:AcrR family transcriptional regulator